MVFDQEKYDFVAPLDDTDGWMIIGNDIDQAKDMAPTLNPEFATDLQKWDPYANLGSNPEIPSRDGLGAVMRYDGLANTALRGITVVHAVGHMAIENNRDYVREANRKYLAYGARQRFIDNKKGIIFGYISNIGARASS